jgi:twinkle protein
LKKTIDDFIPYGLDPTKISEQRIECKSCIARGVSNPREKCLAVNLSKGVFHCHKCGDDYSGVIETIDKPLEHTQKPYNEPKPVDKYDLSTKAIEFFKSRLISLNTLKRFKVTADEKSINFNFFKYDKLINIKRRFPQKKFSLEKGCEITFYNYDAINDECVLITEGEIDALTVYECMPNMPVVSLPNGANSLNFLDNEIEVLENVNEIIIATDGDNKGIEARNRLIARFGNDRASFIVYPKDCKDLNEVLINHGKDEVIKCIEDRRQVPIKAVYTAQDYEEEIKNYIINGFPDGLDTGTELDNVIKLMLSEFVIISGTPNAGKSTVLDWITSLHVSSMKNNVRVCVLSAENKVSIHITKIATHFLKRKVADSGIVDSDVQGVLNFINDNYVFVSTPDMDDMNYMAVIDKMKEVVKRYGCNYFIVDPYNYIERESTDHTSHAPTLRAFANFAKNYNALTMLVAHPRKMEKTEDGNYRYVTPYDIAGSSDFYNIADTILSVWRDFQTNKNTILVQKVRNEWLGSCPSEIEIEYENGTYQVCTNPSF